MKKTLLKLLPLCAFALFLIIIPKDASAGTVHSASYYEKNDDDEHSTESDSDNINDELEQCGSVTLVSGEKYYLDSTLYLEKGWKINAKKAKIYTTGRIMECNYSIKGYKKLNATVTGGIWRYDGKSGHSLTAIQLSHVNGVTFKNMNIKYCTYQGHTFELIACKNVSIKNCKIRCYGKVKSTSNEEQIQIDIDAPATAPTTGVHNGKCCANITISKCDVVGSRAVCANYTAANGGKYKNHFHKNIKVKNCKLRGKSAEALALFNTTGATVTGNTIINTTPTSRDSYSDGMAITYFGSGASGGKYTIKNNTIKGGRHALLMYSHSSSRFGKTTIRSNKLYCKAGASNALKTASVSKLSASKNKKYKW
ncbi:MAG: hypothetical protein K6G01_08945 [Eubacterium sp.]|nr:hypothetical protein [Eubacterium sp.]